MVKSTARSPLVAHVIHRLDVGGLENGLVNLINRMPPDRYNHAIICLTDYTDFVQRIRRDDVPVFALHKREGKDLGVYVRLWKLLRRLRPEIVHTRNLAALEAVLPAALASVPCRLHGEHGRDVHDLDMRSRKYQWLRRALRPLVHHYVALSGELKAYLLLRIRVPARRISQIYNGVDSEHFHPPAAGREDLPVPGFAPAGTIVLGTVGRMKAVKDQLNLARAFVGLLERVPNARARLRLVMVGDGPLMPEVKQILASVQAESLAWLPGDRKDIPQVLRGLDIFVLPSLAEGISNGILEAMASGLPVVATRVGGNPELVLEGETGFLVPRDNPEALAAAIERYLDAPELIVRHGEAARRHVEAEFSVERMVERYMSLYDSVLAGWA